MKRVTVDGKTYSFPDDATPEEMEGIISGSAPALSAPSSNTQENLTTPGPEFQDRVIEGLPTAGGMVGGWLGSPGGPPGRATGAALGGAAGEAGRQAIKGEKMDPGKMAFEGGMQGLYSVGGDLLAKGAGAAARPVMRRALGVGKSIGGQTKVGSSKFPDVVETTLKEKIPVTEKGALKATALREGSAAELKKLLNTAKLGGKKFDTGNVTKHVKGLLRDPVLPSKEKEKILSDLISFYKDRGLKMSPDILQGVKKYYQDQAKLIAKQGGNSLADQPSKKFAKAMRLGAQEELETIPGVAERNQRTQSLIGAERAVENAVRKPSAKFEFHKPGTYPVAKALYGSENSSRLALALVDPRVQAALRQSPRAAAELIQQMMLTAEPDTTEAQ